MFDHMAVIGNHDGGAGFDALLRVTCDDFWVGIGQHFSQNSGIERAVGINRLNDSVDGRALCHFVSGHGGGCWFFFRRC